MHDWTTAAKSQPHAVARQSCSRLLHKSRGRTTARPAVKYTLRDAKSPIGVAEYRLLPPKWKAELPKATQLKQLLARKEVPGED